MVTGPVKAEAEHAGCGDPACDMCHPPRGRCEACGALHADLSVPYCSLACALAGVRARRAGDGRPAPGEGAAD